MMNTETWTEERLALLHEMKESQTKEIREALNKMPGLRLSRGTVAGKYLRLFGTRYRTKTPEEKLATHKAKLARRAKSNADRKHLSIGSQVQAINRGPKVKPEKFKSRVADVVSLRKPILDLMEMECRWADEHRNEQGIHTFCGNPTLDGSSYCECHLEINRGIGTPSERSANRVLRAVA